MAAAVLPKADRRFQVRGAAVPDAGSAEQKQERGGLWLRAARLRADLGDLARARELLARIEQDAAGTAEADDGAA